MKDNFQNLNKMLSHRIRGFCDYEHTMSAFERALSSDVKYIEIDTRVSKDGQIFVYHDYVTQKQHLGSSTKFANSQSVTIESLRYLNGQKIPKLDELLERFGEQENTQQILCIDIKDFGFEQEHYDLVSKYGLENRVNWVSWIPQTCLALHKIDTTIPIVLSHWNLIKFGALGRAVGSFIENRMWGYQQYVAIGHNKYKHTLDEYSHGYQHALICTELPPELTESLASSGGGICVNTITVGKKLIKYCQANNLKLFIFSVNDSDKYNRFSNIEGVDVIFCDDNIGRKMIHEGAEDTA